MAAARLSAVYRFLSEALQAWRSEHHKAVVSGGPVREGPPWPYVTEDKIAARATREQGTTEKSRKQFVRRLKRFQYPYFAKHPYGAKISRGKTFYRHVPGLGLLNFLLGSPFLDVIRTAWFLRRH
jgi:hypothetical protein